MSYLTERAERAVLAALLGDPDPPLHMYGLHAEDFTSDLHRQVFTILTDLATTRPVPMVERDQLIAARLDPPTLTAADLGELRSHPGTCPPEAYAQIVRAAALYRDLTHQAKASAHRATIGPAADPILADHEHKLAAALRRHAHAFAALLTADVTHPVDVEITTTDPGRAALEDQVLAHLLSGPDQIPVLRGFLTDNAFTAAMRRHVYRTMVTMDADGEPIDEITLAWQVEVDLAHARVHGIDVNAPGSTPDESVYPTSDADPAPSPTAYVVRLVTTEITTESAVHAGRELLARHLHDVLPNPAATAQAILTHRNHAVSPMPSTQPSKITTGVESPRPTAPAPGRADVRPPEPMPATGPEPQPGTASTPTPSTQPGVRP